MATCYKITVQTTNAGNGTFVAKAPESLDEQYLDCEDGVFYYCGELCDIHKFVDEPYVLKIERLGIAYT